MLFDQENMFFDGASAITSGSNVICNVGGGDAVDPLFLVVHSTAAESSSLSFALQTSDAEGFGTNVVLGTFASKANDKGVLIKAKVPYGAKKYLRLVGTGTPAGKITAGLTQTVPNA